MMMKNITLSNVTDEAGLFIDGDWIESKDQDPNGEVRLIQLADIGDGIFLNKSHRFLTKRKALELKCTFLQKGDLLIARMPDPLGRTCIFPGDERECVTVVDIGILRPNSKEISNEYLKDLINSPDFRNKIISYTTGTTRKRISRGNLDKIHFNLPVYEDQIRIVAVLTRAEKLIAKRKESIKALEEFLKSTFQEMFGLNSTGYKQWGVEPLNTNTEIVSGVTKGKKYKSSRLREVPYMRVANVQDGHFDLKEIKKIEVTDDEVQKYKLRKGDLLLTEGGDPDKLGRGAVWNNEIDECIHQNHIFRVRVSDASINPVFLSALMASKYGKSYFLKAAKQTTGIASINSTQLKAFPLITPPLSLQNQFAAIVKKVESLKAKHTQSLTELENLYSSLSQRAFKGELDLSKVPLEKENQVIELYDEGMAAATMTNKLSASKYNPKPS